jgi:hypothetical protein
MDGRPKGTTIQNILHSDKCCTAAMAEITHLYKEEYMKAKSMGKARVAVGTYKRIHEEVKKIETYQRISCILITLVKQG